jgi:hypothetical protein
MLVGSFTVLNMASSQMEWCLGVFIFLGFQFCSSSFKLFSVWWSTSQVVLSFFLYCSILFLFSFTFYCFCMFMLIGLLVFCFYICLLFVLMYWSMSFDGIKIVLLLNSCIILSVEITKSNIFFFFFFFKNNYMFGLHWFWFYVIRTYQL